MPASTTNNKGLSNPAAVAASTPAGQKAISSAVETQARIAEAGIQLIPFLVKTGIVLGVGYYLYTKYTNRFTKVAYNPNYPAANVSDGQAQAKAEAIYKAMVGPSSNVNAVATQLQGLNFNGWIKVYNAFGNRESAIGIGKDMNLVEWLHDQFNTSEMAQLRFVLQGVF